MPEFVLDDDPAGFAKIKVVGVGGGGCNAVDSMFDLGLQNVEFYVINSDLQALQRSKCPNRMQIGAEDTLGRGCGADPRLGMKCMEDAEEIVRETLNGADIVFVTAGLGGGTGTGGAPVVAKVAKEMGILTVSVVTKPFKFEGPRRMKSADQGLEFIRESSDTVIVINNERLLEVVGPKIPMKEAFQTADKVLSQAVMSISDLVATPGLINVDFNDIRTIMGGKGGAVMGVGIGKGESRASEAVKKATNSPLLDKVVIDGATGILICITGGPDITLAEVSEATELVAQAADPDAEIIFGAVIDESLTDTMRVTLIATGFSDELHRKRELEKAMESAPVSRGRVLQQPTVHQRPIAPAPAEPQLQQDVIEDEPAIAPHLLNDSAPAAPEAPAAPQQPQASAEPEDSLRGFFGEMIEEGDDFEAPQQQPQAQQQQQAPTQPNGKPAIRVASRSTNPAPGNGGGNGHGVVRPAASSVRPASQQQPARHVGEVRKAEEEPVNVPQYSPTKEKAAEQQEDLDTPAFLRRRRSLFD